MTNFTLADVKLPDFGLPASRPELPIGIYRERLDAFRKSLIHIGIDAAVIYADREHAANIAYLTGFEPRFEEALLILDPRREPVIITGPENQGYASSSPLQPDVWLYPSFGLLGQDRSKTPPLADMLAKAGLIKGQSIGLVGWKFFGHMETADPDQWMDAPAYIVDTVRQIAGDSGRCINITRLLMDSSLGMRAVNEVAQLAQFEFSACHASESVKRLIFGLRPGMTEYEAAQLLQPIGLPLSCHTMLMSGDRTRLGLASPSSRRLQIGEPFTVAFGFCCGLSCRSGFLVHDATELATNIQDYCERLAGPYFACAAEWYETIGIGISGGEVDAMVRRHLGAPFFGLILNPGHLIHLDEWMNTPIYPDSRERLRSGQALQIDIIPATGSDYASINIEDGIALLDEKGRAEFRDSFPEAWSRIEARRSFMSDVLGIRLKAEVLPFSNLAGYLPPFLLSPGVAFVKS